MFTGIIEELGTVEAAAPRLRGRCATVLQDLTEGASIAVNGVCLTAVGLRPDSFSADVAPETLRRTSSVGPIDDIPLGKPTALIADVPVGTGYPTPPVKRVVSVVRRQGQELRALSNICTHLQCDVHWEPSRGNFLCPCHGGMYDIDGKNIGGPPPQPLAQWNHRFTTDAQGRTILEIVPEAEQVISYGLPAFRVGGKTVAGFAAFKTHLSYLPFSGSVLDQLAGRLGNYTMTKSSLHFPVDRPLPKALVKKLIAVRLADASRRSG